MVTPEAALAVIEEPRVVRLGEARPQTTLDLATTMATALADVVEKQHLYSDIRQKQKDGSYKTKKYPTVEAWMTIARMDNVVAREAEAPTRQDDGAYEAFVELVRLSDGLVVGRGSALCGSKGDYPWDGRPDPVKRSMAVTRATSRAFRQQYSWIMALAGYEATPAEEMPQDDRPRNVSPDPYGHDEGAAANRTTHVDGLVGKAITSGTQDFELRQHPEKGFTLPFRVKEGKLSQIVLAQGELAMQLADAKDDVLDKLVTVWGHYTDEWFPDKKRPGEVIVYKILNAERVKVGDRVLPEQSDVIPVAEGQLGFDAAESARLDEAEAARA